MKFTTATIAILATAVSAQSIAELTASIPACAQTCLATAIGNSGCGVDDNACQCGDANAAITREATPCVISGCSSEEALNTQSITSQICALVAAGGSSGGSSAASSAATSAASSVSSAASSAASSATSMASSMASSMSSAASSAASSVSEAATATTSAPVEATNAASKEKVGSFMAGAAILAAIAL
ncbi:hypothetical protein IFR04_011253 [Cadophora malorum]|uniref:CFEM domain-containing protein n=1 Tax=Cadophora malorum TaxID=108018 RepID=A0A8H7T5P2_9HELO|nr:hypothetical protein IFR04_011253 [Cadophora malorum]